MPLFSSTQKGRTHTHIWNIHLCTPTHCTLHHLVCPVGCPGNIGMGQVFTFARVGWWNIVQNTMIHRKSIVKSGLHRLHVVGSLLI